MRASFSQLRRSFRSPLGRLAGIALLVLCLLPGRYLPAAPLSESEVKAAYIVNILKLTERRSTAGSSDLVLCLIDPGLMADSLLHLDGTLIRGRKLRVQLAPKNALPPCDALFFGHTAGHLPYLAKASAGGLLTIGQDADFVASSGMVALLVENRRVVVEINRLAARDGDWRFSSHLLEIARLSNGGGR